MRHCPKRSDENGVSVAVAARYPNYTHAHVHQAKVGMHDAGDLGCSLLLTSMPSRSNDAQRVIVGVASKSDVVQRVVVDGVSKADVDFGAGGMKRVDVGRQP